MKAKINLIDSTDNLFEDFMFKRIKNQMDEDSDIHWGKCINVVILSDRCLGRAIGLTEYLLKSTDLSSVILLTTYEEVEEYIKGVVPDILIFVGMQDEKTNYALQYKILKINPYALIVMYAALDSIINKECRSYSIDYAFCTWEPVKEFVAYLQESLITNKKLIEQQLENKSKDYETATNAIDKDRNLSLFDKLKKWLFQEF